MKLRLLISLLLFGILAACGGGGGGGGSATDTSITNPSAPQFNVRVRQLATLAEGSVDVSNIDEEDGFSDIKTQLERIAKRSLVESEVDAVLLLLNGRLTEGYCGQRSQVLSADGRSCQAPEPTCNLQHRISSGVSYWTCGYSAADCEAAGKVLDNFKVGVCVAPTEAQCRARGQERKGEGINAVCEASIASCNAANKIYKNGSCESCLSDKPTRYGNACGVNAEICESRNQVLQGFVCVALTDAYCRGRGQRLNDASDACRALVVADCTSQGQLLNANGTDCRDVVASDCTLDEQVFDNGACRAVTNADCVAVDKILDNNRCRPLVASDCTDNQIFESNACRALTIADCEREDQILSNGVCQSCTGDNSVRYDNVCGPTAQQCESRGQVLRGAECVSPTAPECRANNQRLNDRGDACRALVASDCLTGTILNDAGNACRPLTGADCSARGMILGAEGCRALIASDCQEGTVLNDAGNACRRLTGVDCSAHGLILNRKGTACRALIASDCQAGTRLNQAGTACRALIQGDCPEGMKLNKEGTACRILTNSDCPAGTKLKSDGRACRALIASDCEEGTILNGAGIKCRALVESDCPDGTRLNPQGTACRFSLTVADCARQHKLLNDAGNACRNVTMRDCETHYNTWPATGEFMLVRNVCIGLAHMVCYEQNKVRDPEHPNSFRCAACPAGEYVANVNICARCPAGRTLNDAGNGCRALTAADCSQTQVFENGACRTRVATDCSQTQVFENGVCRTRVAADCSQSQVFENGACRSLCPRGEEIVGGVCKATIASCNAIDEVFRRFNDGRGGYCKPCDSVGYQRRTGNTCPFLDYYYPILTVCPIGQAPGYKRGVCRPLVASDCPAGTVLNNERTLCRALIRESCPEGMQLNVAGTSCVGSTNTDCPVGTKSGSGGTICRALVVDCPANMVLNRAGTACRMPKEDDVCTETTIDSKGCGVFVAAACEEGTTLNDRGNACRPLVASDCYNHPYSSDKSFILKLNSERTACIRVKPHARSSTSERFVELLSDDPIDTANSFLQANSSDPIRMNWYGMEINVNPYYHYNYNANSRSEYLSFLALRRFGDDVTAYTGATAGKDKDLFLLGLDLYDYRFIIRNHDEHDIRLYGMGYSTEINQSEYRVGFEHGSDHLTSGHFLWNYQF